MLERSRLKKHPNIGNLKFVLQWVRRCILFLCETKMLTIQMQSIKRKFGFDNCFIVDQNGLRDGLALLWMDDVDLTIVSYSDTIQIVK